MVEEVKYRQIQDYLLTLSLTSQKITIRACHNQTRQKYYCEFLRGELPQRIVFFYSIEEGFFEALLQDNLFVEQENLYLIYRSDGLDRTLSKLIVIPLSRVQVQQIVEIKRKPNLLDLGQSIHDYCYLDIESTGLRKNVGDRFKITTIVLFDGKEVRYYVNNGKDLEKFKQDIKEYKVVITFYGDIFDLPQIAAQLGVNWDGVISFDLQKIYSDLGFKGSLKKLKQVDLRMAHPVLKDVDGLMAPFLWKMHLQGDLQALKVLLAYNAEDVIPMRYMVERACQFMKTKGNIAMRYPGVKKANLEKLAKIQHQNQKIMEQFIKTINVDLSQVERFVEEYKRQKKY